MKKKGWSDTKIARRIAQTEAEATRKYEEAIARLSAPHPEIERWIQFVSAVVVGHHADWIGIMVHWYSGDIATEAIAAGNRRWLTLECLTDEYLLNAEEDMLHTITLR